MLETKLYQDLERLSLELGIDIWEMNLEEIVNLLEYYY